MYKGKSLKYRFNYILAFFFIGTTCFFACKKTPEYSFTPAIYSLGNKTFTVVSVETNPNTLVLTESVNINVRFTDGDGDLGLDQFDIKDTLNKNFFLHQFRKKSGASSFIKDSTYLGQFQLLSPKEIRGPVDGTLSQLFLFQESDYTKGDVVYFTVQIKDRAGDSSNVITTPEFLVDFKKP